MLLKLIIISVLLVGLALAGLAITMLIKPGGRFPETHISRNKDLRKRGIRCAQDTDLGCKPGDNMQGCEGCSLH